MKKSILLIAAICAVIFQTHAQDQLYASLWYGQIKTQDLDRHLTLEKNVYTKYHQARIDRGEISGWDIWQITNPDVNDMTTTLIYVHLMDSPVGGDYPVIDALEGVSAEEWAAAQEEAMGHYLKNFQVIVSVKGGYGPQGDDHPADYCVLNYMEVDPYRVAEYEQMELEQFMPMFKAQVEKNGWALHKVINHFGADRPVNYITADFYNDLATIYEGYNTSNPLGEDAQEMLREMDKLRTLKNAHILKRIMSLR